MLSDDDRDVDVESDVSVNLKLSFDGHWPAKPKIN